MIKRNYTMKKPRSERGPYKIKKITKNKKRNIIKYNIPFEPSIDIITDIDIINSQTLIEFEKLLETL